MYLLYTYLIIFSFKINISCWFQEIVKVVKYKISIDPTKVI